MRIQPVIWRHIRNIGAFAFVLWLAWKFYDKELWGAWGHVKAPWLACALASTLVTLMVRYAKWHWLLAEDRVPSGRAESARSLFGAYALASVTPGRLGDFGRCMFMGEGRRARTLLYTLVDKAFDLWAISSLAIASLFLFVSRGLALGATAAWLGLIPLGIFASRWMLNEKRFSARLIRFQEIGRALWKVSARWFSGLAVLACLIDMLTLFSLLHAFHNAGFKVAFATYPWLMIAGSLPISIGGVGPREGLSALLLPLFSVPAAQAINVSLIFFALTAILPAIFGAGWMIVQPPRLDRQWWKHFLNPFGRQGPAAQEC